MNEDVRRSRYLISRRRALSLGGTVSLGALVTACTNSSTPTAAPASTAATGAPLTPSTTASTDVLALLNQANTCTMAKEETQGPYWFDVDQIRSDLREDRPGTALVLAVRAHDLSACANGAAPTPIPNSVVEIWHCDAGGEYSGFESGGGPGGGGGGDTSDGTYSSGDTEAKTSDDGTYLRGAQVADKNGVVQFITVYPGWYRGRTVHIHLKLHVNRKTVVTTQLYFDEAVNEAVFATSPYDERSGRETRNSDDSIYDESGLVTIRKTGAGYLAAINLGLNASTA